MTAATATINSKIIKSPAFSKLKKGSTNYRLLYRERNTISASAVHKHIKQISTVVPHSSPIGPFNTFSTFFQKSSLYHR